MTILYHRSRNYVSCQLDLDMIAFIYAETGPISMARKFAATELAAPIASSPVSNLRGRLNSGITTVQGISEVCKQNRDILDDLFKVVTGRPQPSAPGSAVCQFHLHPKATVCPYAGMDEVLAIPPKDRMYRGCGRSRSRCDDRKARAGRRCPALVDGDRIGWTRVM